MASTSKPGGVGTAGALSAQQARQVIDGVRQILMTHNVQERPAQHRRPEVGAVPQVIKGKYAHVPASSDDFIKRKREELELEDRGGPRRIRRYRVLEAGR